MSPGLLPLGGLSLLIFGWIASRAVANPLLLRLATREAVRRRSQTVLVVAGLMIGSAGITAALVGADSAEESAVLNAYRAWGMTDLLVTADERSFPAEVATRLASDPEVAAKVDGIQAGLELVGSAADLDSRQGESGVRLIGFDPTAQAPFGAFVLTDGRRTLGDDLPPGGVLLSRQLAAALDAEAGDALNVTVERVGENSPTPPIALTVVGIARSEGPGAYGLRSAVFAPIATAQALAGIDLINVVRVSGLGGLEDGIEGGDHALPAIREFAGSASVAGLEVRPVKAIEVDEARRNTEFTTSMLVGMSVLIVAAGSALVVNLVLMLAEERRARLAVIRALGLTRRKLVTLSMIEGAIYALTAAAAGTALGLLAGRIVAARFANAFAQFLGTSVDFSFVFSLKAQTVAVAFAAGWLLMLGVLFFAARRTSRLSIPAAIRNLPEPVREPRRRWPRLVLLVLGALSAVAGLAGSAPFGRLVGGFAAIVVAAAFTGKRIPTHLHSTLAGSALAVWSFVMVGSVSQEVDPSVFFSVFVGAVLGSVFGLTIVVSANLRLAERFFGLVGGLAKWLRAMLRPPLAYLSRRPLRTGLSTGVFAVVLTIVSMLAVFLSIFSPRYERDSAGFDVRVTSTGASSIALPAAVAADVQRQVAIPTLGYVGHFESTFLAGEAQFVPLHRFSRELLADPPVRLTARADRFETDGEVWDALQGDRSNWVVSDFGQPGETIVLRGATGLLRFRVAGTEQDGILDGVIGTKEQLAPFASAPVGTTMLVDTSGGASARDAARTIEASLFAQGVDAITTAELLDRDYRANKTFFSVVDVLMRLGLVVGILSLGILGLRAVTERRHVIGVLRAIGYKRWLVMWGLMAEALITAAIGVFVGVGVGVSMAYVFFKDFAPNTPFGIDGPTILSALGLVFGAVVIVTLAPAWRASRLPPAEAVRYSE